MKKVSRNEFVKVFLGGALAVFAAFGPGKILGAFAADKKKNAKAGAKKDVPLPAGGVEVSATDAVAGAIGYVSDTSKVDKKKYPQFKPGQNCAGCQLYVVSNEGWGKCTMISNGLVKANGWCGSYQPKAKA